MIKSMTGFGRASVGRGQNKIDAEIRSVNSRFLEIKIRGISLEPSVEHEIKSIIEETLYRGNVQVRLESKKSQDEQRLNFNKERFELIQDILKNIHVVYGQRLSLSDIISTNDLLKINEEVNINNNSIINSVKKALDQLCEMRKQEGEQIYKDISKRLDILKSKLSNTESLANNYSTEKQSQLKNKVSELLKGEHNFTASTGDTFKIALYTSSATLGASTTDYSTSNEITNTSIN